MKKEIYISKGVGETRIAVKENGKLAELHVDKQSQVKTVGNIYKGIVENVIPGMQAAFVNIGQDVNAFLPFSEISDSELIVEKNNIRVCNYLLTKNKLTIFSKEFLLLSNLTLKIKFLIKILLYKIKFYE